MPTEKSYTVNDMQFPPTYFFLMLPYFHFFLFLFHIFSLSDLIDVSEIIFLDSSTQFQYFSTCYQQPHTS